MALMLAGCGGGGAPTPPPTLSRIAINPNPIFIGVNTTLNLSATGTYSNGTTADLTSQVTWNSADSTIASMGPAGKVTLGINGVVPKTTSITATLNGMTSPPAILTVTLAGSSSTNGLITPRYDHTATLLQDGTVLVAGGYNTVALRSAELFTPGTTINTGTWTTAGNMGVARRDHTATALTAGQVLLIGGGNDLGDLDSVELYYPVASGSILAGTWKSYSGILTTPRSYHTSTLLNPAFNSGKDIVLVVGGSTASTADRYDLTSPATPASAVADSSPRYSHTATLLQDGRVLVTGGFANSALGAGTVLDTAELFDPTGITMIPAASLITGRYLHSATLIKLADGTFRVLVVGGLDAAFNEVASAELYDPTLGTWTATGSLATARHGHIATLMPNGQVLVMGGLNGNLTLSSAELYDPNTGTWSGTANLQTGRVVFTATLLANGPAATNGKVLVAGGDGGAAGILSSVELHN